MVLRFGPGRGHVVDPEGVVRRKAAPVGGSFFLIDIDSFWQPDEEIPPFDGGELLKRYDYLHQPIRTPFETVITDRLRDEVLRRKNLR